MADTNGKVGAPIVMKTEGTGPEKVVPVKEKKEDESTGTIKDVKMESVAEDVKKDCSPTTEDEKKEDGKKECEQTEELKKESDPADKDGKKDCSPLDGDVKMESVAEDVKKDCSPRAKDEKKEDGKKECEQTEELKKESDPTDKDGKKDCSPLDGDVKMESVAEDVKKDCSPRAKDEKKEDEKKECDQTKEDVKKESESKDEDVKKDSCPPDEDVKMENVPEDVKKDDASESEPEVQVKEDAAKPPTDHELKIIRQVEYYFGDVNLGRDNFLQGQIKEDNGWVKMEIMLKFNRLVQLSDSIPAIVAAVRKSDTGLMEVSEDGTKIRRNPKKPLPVFDKSRREDLKCRSVYVKGFPTDTSLDKLQEFFDKFGSIEHIQRRYDGDKLFKGSVFVIFGKGDEAKKFLETNLIKCEDCELLRLFKDEYYKKKTEDRKSKREDDLKEKEQKKQKQEDEDKETFRNKITLGTVLQLKGLSSDLSVDDLKTQFSEYAEVAWVEYRTGADNARVRFSIEDKGKEALDKARDAGEGSVKVKDKEVEAYVLEGEEEIKFWKTLFQEQRDRKDKNRRGRGKRGGRGGRGGPPSKRRRTNYD